MVVSAFGQTGHQAEIAERPSVTRTMLQDPTGEPDRRSEFPALL